MAAPSFSVFAKYRPLFLRCLRVHRYSCSSHTRVYVPSTCKWAPGQLLSKTLPQLQYVTHHQSTDSSSRVTEGDRQDHSSTGSNLQSCQEDPYAEEVEVCLLCKANIPISYKNPKLLSQFVSPNTGRIFGRHITRLCEMQQERITTAITRSRKYGYMPVMYRDTIFLKDPNLFDVKYTGSSDIGGHIQRPGPDAMGEGRPITLTAHKKPPGDKQKTWKRDKVKLTKAEKRRGVKGKGKS